MLILIDSIGILVIVSLAYQGYKEALGIRKSFLLPSLCSVLVFYKTFPLLHKLISSQVPSQMLAGVLTIAIANFILITIFYKLFVHLLNQFEKHFFLPETSLHNRQIIGIIIGIFTGYIFIAGVIKSLDSTLARNSLKKESVLSKSIFHQISHKKTENTNQVNKIDNLPSLKVLYSEENVAKFDFTEDELVAILQMIRAISNQDAQILLNNINNGTQVRNIYSSLIELYSSQEFIAEKYRVKPEMVKNINNKLIK
jgi:hypothetical protein